MVKVKQINNLKIMQDKEHGCYLVINPEGKTVYKSQYLAEVVRACEMNTKYLKTEMGNKTMGYETTVNKTTGNKTIRIGVSMDKNKMMRYYQYYLVRVPGTVTGYNISSALNNGAYLMKALENKVNMENISITKQNLEVARESYNKFGNTVEAYIYYVRKTKGWAFKSINEFDISLNLIYID